MADKYPKGYGTHWHECWREHHGCCVGRVEQLEAELAKCRKSQGQAQAEAFEEAVQIAETLAEEWQDTDVHYGAAKAAQRIREAAE